MTSPLYSPPSYAKEPTSNDDILALMDNQALAEEIRSDAKTVRALLEKVSKLCFEYSDDAREHLEHASYHLDEALAGLSNAVDAIDAGRC